MPDDGASPQIVVEPEVAKVSPNNMLGRSGRDRDFLYVAEGARGFPGEKKNMTWRAGSNALIADTDRRQKTATYTSPIIPCKFQAKEFLPSWNILLPGDDQSFKIYLRVYNESKSKPSPWFFMGEGGVHIEGAPEKTEAKGWGASKIDYLQLTNPASAFQFKVDFALQNLSADPISAENSPLLRRFFVHYSGEGNRPLSGRTTAETKRMYRVAVPYRSQLDVKTKALRHIICCPTCVAMVLEFYGVDQPTLSVCKSVYDERHKIYGIWPRAAQAAALHGGRAWVHRFRTLSAVREYLETGRPIIASIRVGQGELRGARYPKSNGHLIVITGYRGKSKVLVNDPYSVGPTGSEIEYEAADIEKVWLDKGGVAILIEHEK